MCGLALGGLRAPWVESLALESDPGWRPRKYLLAGSTREHKNNTTRPGENRAWPWWGPRHRSHPTSQIQRMVRPTIFEMPCGAGRGGTEGKNDNVSGRGTGETRDWRA